MMELICIFIVGPLILFTLPIETLIPSIAIMVVSGLIIYLPFGLWTGAIPCRKIGSCRIKRSLNGTFEIESYEKCHRTGTYYWRLLNFGFATKEEAQDHIKKYD